jgi:hypothetical protein
MSKRSTKALDLNQLTAAVVKKSKQLRELVKVNTEELLAELERSHDLHKRYRRQEPRQFTQVYRDSPHASSHFSNSAKI